MRAARQQREEVAKNIAKSERVIDLIEEMLATNASNDSAVELVSMARNLAVIQSQWRQHHAYLSVRSDLDLQGPAPSETLGTAAHKGRIGPVFGLVLGGRL